MEKLEGSCPYCGQAVFPGGDARMACSCPQARRYRMITGMLENVVSGDETMGEIGPEAVEWLVGAVHLLCTYEVGRVTVDLSDGTQIRLGDKVCRSIKLVRDGKADK